MMVYLEDDTGLVDGFRRELLRTVRDLPDSWEVLHLCPGFLWGHRIETGKTVRLYDPSFAFKGRLDPNPPAGVRKYILRQAKRTKNGRAFSPRWPCPPKKGCPKTTVNFPGAPTAMVVRNARAARRLLHQCDKERRRAERRPIDVFLQAHIVAGRVLAAAEPQLCYHRYTGGSVRGEHSY